MPQDDKRGVDNQHRDQKDTYLEGLDRLKVRSFSTFGVLIFWIAMAIAVMVEIAGAIKVWDAEFSGQTPVHADVVRAQGIDCSAAGEAGLPPVRKRDACAAMGWEYKVIPIPAGYARGVGAKQHSDRLESILSIQGEAGWELVSVSGSMAEGLHLFLKRPRQ